jgi:hypothetical protein
MALKPHRSARMVYRGPGPYMDEVAERGGVTVYSTHGSGAALDQSTHLVTYAATPSGKVVCGVLHDDMVDVDLTRYKLNQHKQEVQKGGKVSISAQGWVQTNMTEGTVTVGNAYLGHSGRIRSTIDNNIANSPLVGVVHATADEDGYVKFSYLIV